MPVLVQFEGEGNKNFRDSKKNVYRSDFAFIQHTFIQILLGLSEVTAPWQVSYLSAGSYRWTYSPTSSCVGSS